MYDKIYVTQKIFQPEGPLVIGIVTQGRSALHCYNFYKTQLAFYNSNLMIIS